MFALQTSVATESWSGRQLVVMVDERSFESWPGLLALEQEFETRYPGLDVRLTDMGGAVGQQDKPRFMLSGDLQLDVARIDVTEFGAFLAENALIDLEPYCAADPTWNADEYWSVLDGLRDARGHLYGLPSTFTPYVMYFNRDLLRKHGFDAPREGWTWDDLVRACRATTVDLDGDGRTDQFGISLTQWLQAVTPWIWQNGGELLDETHQRSLWNRAETVEALEFVRGLLHEERVASFDASFENQLSQGLFQAGRAAFYGPVGYWETYRFKYITEFEWDVAPLPRGAREATSIAMTAYVVPRTSREPQIAYEFVRRLAGDSFQRLLARIGNGVPGRISAARSADFLKVDVAPRSEHVFLDVLPSARFMPPLANWRKIEDLCAAELQSILLLDECDVAAACERMTRRTDEFLARERVRTAREPLFPGAMSLAVSLALISAMVGFVLRRGRAPGRVGRAEERSAYTMLIPWVLGFAMFAFGPAVVTVMLSMCEWSPLRELGSARWVGFENYARLAADPTFHRSFFATVTYAFASVPIGLSLALAIALLLREDNSWSNAVRTLVFVPSIVSPVIVAAVWRFLLDPERGLFNEWLFRCGLPTPAWIRSPSWVVPSFVLMSLWSIGGQMLVFVAALKSLDRNLDDAARIDGAGWWRRTWHVTLPQLAPVILFNAMIGLLNAFQIFAQPYIVTQGGPGDASRFLVLYLYESGFRHLDMGYASAIAWVLFALLGGSAWLLWHFASRRVHYAARADT